MLIDNKGVVTWRTFALLLLLAAEPASLAGQQTPASPGVKDQPQVRINYLNVCTPDESKQAEIRNALGNVPAPKFSPDFEISRGRSTVEGVPTANWVRIRREFPNASPFIAAQYALTVDENSIIETLVFRVRDPKDVLQIQLENTVTGAQDAQSVLATDTPVSRLKLERFGKSSVVLTRCPAADQSKYEPLFTQASSLLARYRAAIGVKRLVPRELSMLGPIKASPKPKPAAKKR